MRGGISSLSEIQKAMAKTKPKAKQMNWMSLIGTSKPKAKPMHGMSLNDIKELMSRKYKTSEELLDLSNLLNNVENREKIRNGREITVSYKGRKLTINPNKPPSFITYEMLLNENLEEDDVGEQIELTKKRKNMLRIKWWNAWYKIITGYYRREEKQQGGGFDFESKKANIIKQLIKRIKEGTITDANVRKRAEDFLQSRNVKMLKPVNTTLPAQKRKIVKEVNEDTMDMDDFNEIMTETKARRRTEADVRKTRIKMLRKQNRVKITDEDKEGYIDELVNNEEVIKALEARRPVPQARPRTPSVPQVPQVPQARPRNQSAPTPNTFVRPQARPRNQSAPTPPRTSSSSTRVSPVPPRQRNSPVPIPSNEQIDDDLKQIEDQVLSTADNSQQQYGETVRQRFEVAFSIAKLSRRARMNIKNSYVKKIIVGNLADYNAEPREMKYTNGSVELFKITDNLHLYGMQLLPQFDRIKLLHSMLHLIETRKIYSIVDLHDCKSTNVDTPDIAYSIGCNPYDMSCTEDVYNMVMDAIEPSKPKRYHRITNYFDMSPGFPSAWDKISKIERTVDANNSVTVHCLAGKGRTGSVLLYLFLRDSMPDEAIRRRLGLPHFGFNDISECIYHINDSLFNDPTTSAYQTYKDASSREIFRIGFELSMCGLTSSILLRQRLNRVYFFLAREKGVNRFYNYGRPAIVGSCPWDEFSVPMERTVNWSQYDSVGYDSDVFD